MARRYNLGAQPPPPPPPRPEKVQKSPAWIGLSVILEYNNSILTNGTIAKFLMLLKGYRRVLTMQYFIVSLLIQNTRC